VPATSVAEAPSTATTAPQGFIGRYRTGPLRAPIRIVMFIDYQCLGCNMLEHELKPILAARDDISFSVKLWPGNRECNPYVPPGMETSHEFSCGAARDAEAVGVVGGNDAFWKVHHWLFERSARYTEDELLAFVAGLGLDIDEYQRARQSDLVRERIAADIEEGFSLGLASTPMVFVNGREFEGWSAPQAMTRLIEQAKQVNLPIRGPESDRPPPALKKYVDMFLRQRIRQIPDPIRCWTTGPADARWKIVAWGDYQQPYTILADAILRQLVAERDDISYTFRPFPLNEACNPAVEGAKHELSCRAAQAAQAAGTLGGADAYWKMHAWLMENAERLGAQTLLEAIQSLKLDPGQFRQTMESPELNDAIALEAEAAQKVELKNSPIMFVNGRVIPRWMHGDTPVLREVLTLGLDALAKQPPAPGTP
jgi:protein-disulfide isomerase